MAGDAWTVVDNVSPALQRLAHNLERARGRRQFAMYGQKTAAMAKRAMSHSVGFSDQVPYKKLKIKWRYHGHKQLMRGDVVNKTRVTARSKPLIDTGALRRSWGVLRVKPGRVDVGNTTSAEKNKASYNDDRGRWDWGRRPADVITRMFQEAIDRGVFG